MKSLKKFGFAVIAAAMFMVVGCKTDIEPPHEHTYNEEWSGDEKNHWHDPSCDDTDKVKDKGAHKWDKGEVTKEPTCTEDGEKTYTCTVCGKTKTAVGKKALGHKSDDGEVTKAATCTEKGEKTYKCAVCDVVMKTEEIPAAGHDYESEVTKVKTCDADGEMKYTCTVCKETKTEVIAKGHTYSEGWTTDATHHWHVATCEHTAEVSGKAEHKWDAGEETKVPTCGADGVKTYTCTVCSATKTEAVPATGKHTYGELTIANGIGTKNCTVCNSGFKGPVLKAGGSADGGAFQNALKNDLSVKTNENANVTKVVFGLMSDSDIAAKVGVLTKKTDIGAVDDTCYAYAENDGENLIIYIVPKDDDATGFVFKEDSSYMFYAFCKCEEIAGLSLADTSNVTNMHSMFSFCEALTALDVSGFDTSQVTDMVYMFCSCKALTTLELSGFDTKKVENMGYMFWFCDKLTTLDVSGFDTSNVTDMDSIFDNCPNLETIYVKDADNADNFKKVTWGENFVIKQ